MPQEQEWIYTRPITIERKFLRRPNCNIITIYRLEGELLKIQVESAIIRLGKKHPLLFAHIEFNNENQPIFKCKSNINIPIIDIYAQTSSEWISVIEQEHSHYFPLDIGPLSRIILVHFQKQCDLILNCHHLISDGLSCTFVVKDLLDYIENPNKIQLSIADPPLSTQNIPVSVKLSWKLQIMTKLIRKLSQKYPYTFTEAQFRDLHKKYWTSLSFEPLFVPIQLSPDDTQLIIKACKKHQVSVNSFLNTAFMRTCQILFGNKKSYLHDLGSPVNVRDRFKVPVGGQLGLFASGIITKFIYQKKEPFWTNATQLNAKIRDLIGSDKSLWEIFYYMAQMNHSILDTLYFVAYNGLSIPPLNRYIPLIRRIGSCTAIDNLGKFAFPLSYRAYKIYAIYSNVFFSNMVQLLIGVITVGTQMCFALTYSPNLISQDLIMKIWQSTYKNIIEVCQN